MRFNRVQETFVAPLLIRIRAGLETLTVDSPELEFLPPAEQVLKAPPSPARIAILRTICAMFVVAILGGYFGKLDVYTVGRGRIQPVGRSKVVQPADAGQIRAMYAKDGMHVRAGQLLVDLDPIEADATQKALVSQVASLDAEIARRSVAITNAQRNLFFDSTSISFPKDVDENIRERERAVLQADLVRLGSQVAVDRAKIEEDVSKEAAASATIEAESHLLKTLSERVQMRQGLERDGWESHANVIDASETLERETASYDRALGDRSALVAEIQTLRKQLIDDLSHFISDNAEALETAQTKRDQQAQDLVKASEKLKRTKVVAPIDGTVQQLALTTVGQVVSQGQQLMTIVPDHIGLEIVAQIEDRDIGFVKVGQPVVLKVNAYPFTRYGTLSGHVEAVSRDAVQLSEDDQEENTQQKPLSDQASGDAPVPKAQNLIFPITIALDDNLSSLNHERPLSAGMTVTVEIKTGQRRAIDYLLAPVNEALSAAGHER